MTKHLIFFPKIPNVDQAFWQLFSKYSDIDQTFYIFSKESQRWLSILLIIFQRIPTLTSNFWATLPNANVPIFQLKFPTLIKTTVTEIWLSFSTLTKAKFILKYPHTRKALMWNLSVLHHDLNCQDTISFEMLSHMLPLQMCLFMLSRSKQSWNQTLDLKQSFNSIAELQNHRKKHR